MTADSSLNPEKISSEEGGEKVEPPEILSDSELRAKYGANASRKAALSKREMMEALTRERFPWEE